eukprot:16097900-Heterocapsa_arctica.AAC.1
MLYNQYHTKQNKHEQLLCIILHCMESYHLLRAQQPRLAASPASGQPTDRARETEAKARGR